MDWGFDSMENGAAEAFRTDFADVWVSGLSWGIEGVGENGFQVGGVFEIVTDGGKGLLFSWSNLILDSRM